MSGDIQGGDIQGGDIQGGDIQGADAGAPDMRQCTKCLRHRPAKDFARAAGKKDGLGSWCSQCLRHKRYDISPEAQEALLASQKNRCRGCRRQFSDELPYQVDHCHVSLRVRALLCNLCNNCLGQLPTVERLSAAQAYVRRHNARLGITPPPLPD